MIPKLEEYQKRWGIESELVIKPGLDSMNKALNMLGNPHEKLKVVHIAGTNGKGSTTAFLHSIFAAHGWKTASFTSPWIFDVHDQIQLAGRNISPDEMDAVFKKLKEAGVGGLLTEFELLTVAAFMAFEDFHPDIVLLEAGMGGRYDSTNVVTPLVSVITSIGLEHTQFLGGTHKEIAWQKGGILKENVPVVTGRLPEEAAAVISDIAGNMNSKLYRYEKEFHISRNNGLETYRFGEKVIPNLQKELLGAHQSSNMAIAITTALLVLGNDYSAERIRKGVGKAINPGRFEKIAERVYMDGAHNVDSAKALKDLLEERFPETEIHFVVGMLKDKDIEGFIRELSAVATSFTFVAFDHERAEDPRQMMNKCQIDMKIAINKNKVTLDLLSNREGVTIITGSLYLLTELRALLHGNLENNQNS